MIVTQRKEVRVNEDGGHDTTTRMVVDNVQKL